MKLGVYHLVVLDYENSYKAYVIATCQALILNLDILENRNHK